MDSFNATYGLTGFGARRSHDPASPLAHKHLVGGGDFGTAGQFGTATGSLVTSGSTEDGHQAIDFALNNYTYTPGAVKNLILVTDEDSDNRSPGINAATVASGLSGASAMLNAVINVKFKCNYGHGPRALGMSSGGVGYKADGAGGFTTCANAKAVSGSGTSIADYVGLAINSGGAAWDLNQLRAGGLTAMSFTNAFVDIKVQEITGVPEPTTVAFLGLGILSMGMLRKQKKQNELI